MVRVGSGSVSEIAAVIGFVLVIVERIGVIFDDFEDVVIGVIGSGFSASAELRRFVLSRFADIGYGEFRHVLRGGVDTVFVLEKGRYLLRGDVVRVVDTVNEFIVSRFVGELHEHDVVEVNGAGA